MTLAKIESNSKHFIVGKNSSKFITRPIYKIIADIAPTVSANVVVLPNNEAGITTPTAAKTKKNSTVKIPTNGFKDNKKHVTE